MRLNLSLVLLTLLSTPLHGSEPPADLLLTNGRAYTVDAARSWATTIAIRDGRIVHVGDAPGAAGLTGPATKRVDLAGRLVLPAFHDSHVHPVSAGVELAQCDLNGAADVAALEQKVRACAASRPEGAWVVGGGWALPLFPDANPTREALDALVGGRPAILHAADGHSAWVSTAALRVAGVTRDTRDPADGRIERDARTGEPSGTLREGASGLVSRHAPSVTPAERRAGLKRAIEHLNRLGVVGVQEASAGQETLDTYLAADREGWLTARARISLHADPEKGLGQIPDLLARRKQRSRRVVPDAVKLFLDGVIEARTAALLQPYVADPKKPDAPPTKGLPNFTPAALDALVAALDREGFQVHMHAIGDAAIRIGLDAVAAARNTNGPRDARHEMAHIQLFDPADIPRFRELGVIANFQPLWAYADSYITDLTEPVVGPARSRWLYPIRSVVDSGAVVVAGSDWSVSSANPIEAMQVAVTRRALDGKTPAWIPEERVGLPDIIAAYTIGGAYAAFLERETGSIEVGKSADLVVLDRNLFEVPAEKIHETQVVWTLLEGRTVWRQDGAP